jgi:hypothetical protein
VVILFRILLRVVWKRKDRDGRCLRSLLGFDAEWPIAEIEEETNEEFTTYFALPGRPKTEEEIEEEEAQKAIDSFNKLARERGQPEAAMKRKDRETFGGLPAGKPVLDGNTGIISWEFGCEFQHAVYDLMQDRWRAMVCPECGKYFVAEKTAQKYCSPECWGKRKKEQALAYYNRKGKLARQKAKTLRAKSHRRKS